MLHGLRQPGVTVDADPEQVLLYPAEVPGPGVSGTAGIGARVHADRMSGFAAG